MKNKYIHRFILFSIIIVAWEITYRLHFFSPLLFPSTLAICSSLFYAFSTGNLLNSLIYSFNIILISLSIGIVLAVALATASAFSPKIEEFCTSLISIAHPLPGIALLPLIILWVGANQKAIILIIVHSILWPLLLNLLMGFQSIPLIYKQLGANFELSKFKYTTAILFPSSFPYFISGLKIAWARSWRALISAEMIFGAAGGVGGIGWFMYTSRVFMDTPALFAGIIVIIAIGIFVEDFVFSKLEQKTLSRWGMLS